MGIYTLLEPGPFLGPEIPGEFFYLMDRNLLIMGAVPWRMIFCSSLMLLAPGIFPKLCSIPFLISPSTPTITGTTSVLILYILVVSISKSLYFESFIVIIIIIIIVVMMMMMMMMMMMILIIAIITNFVFILALDNIPKGLC